MTNDSNQYVQAVNKPKNGDSTPPALVLQIKENSLSILLSYLENLFGSCDDLFFDLSSRAASNTEQNLYFESMRELRVRKNGVIENFKHRMKQVFADFPKPDTDSSKNDESLRNTSEGLSLVQHDEIEQKVAINGMISKARSNNQEALYQLTTRLDYLSTAKRINNSNNPLDPEQICHGFADACELLDINIKAKIILYKQFDRLVISKLANVYSTANDFLINAGVIPTITHSINKDADTKVASQNVNTESSSETPNTPNQPGFDFTELSNLLSSLRALGLDRIPNYQTYSANPGPIMSNQDLLTTLSLLQLQHLQIPNHSVDLREIISSILSGPTPEKPKSVKQSDEDIINLVAMFFDFVLDDKNLPLAFQALISRLQIPILKVALRDKNFFSNNEHPARKLVNSLASASIGWDDAENTEKDKTYKAIAEIVQSITESNAENDSIYVEKLQQVQKLIKQTEHRSALIEKRTSQAAEGEAKTRKAKHATQQLLYKQLETAQLPQVVNDFLVDHWQQLLIIIHLKHGEESAQWIDASQLVGDLIWVCRPHQDEKSRLRLDKIKADLVKRIHQGLDEAAVTGEESDRITNDIQNVIEALQHQTLNPDKRETPIELHTLTAEQAKNLGHTPGGGSKSWKDMTALERQQARYKKLTYEFIKKAENLPLNTWLSYEDTKQGKTLRCKLATMIEASDSFIFVNKFGFKVLEKTRKEFAYDMQQKRAKPIQSGLLFERAMSSITANLRDLAKPSPPSYQT
jgi:Protein of unknown function (DUF1631)